MRAETDQPLRRSKCRCLRLSGMGLTASRTDRLRNLQVPVGQIRVRTAALHQVAEHFGSPSQVVASIAVRYLTVNSDRFSVLAP